MRSYDELRTLIVEKYGWDSELIDAVGARLAALEAVAELGRAVVDRSNAAGDGDYAAESELTEALIRLDQGLAELERTD